MPDIFRINELVHFVNNELMLHMKKEEVILFPFIRSLVNDKKITITKEMLEGPIHMMEIEHESVRGKVYRNCYSNESFYSTGNSLCIIFNVI